MTHALVDTDVLHKTAAFGILGNLLESHPFGATTFSMLGAAKFMILKKLDRRAPARGAEVAKAEFTEAIATVSILEPTKEELEHAASLERKATQLNLALDQGESILCAILITRLIDFIFTGDKRAVNAMAGLISNDPEVLPAQKVISMEQLLKWLIDHRSYEDIRQHICSERETDKALSNCFACSSPSGNVGSSVEGLTSYINHLNQSAPGVLFPS